MSSAMVGRGELDGKGIGDGEGDASGIGEGSTWRMEEEKALGTGFVEMDVGCG